MAISRLHCIIIWSLAWSGEMLVLKSVIILLPFEKDLSEATEVTTIPKISIATKANWWSSVPILSNQYLFKSVILESRFSNRRCKGAFCISFLVPFSSCFFF